MQIEKIDENKIRITLDMNDLKNKNVDFDSFTSNSIESHALFVDMLEKADEKFGFSTKNHKLIIETVVMQDSYFILTITRIEQVAPKQKNISPIRTSSKTLKKSLIYSFNTFENFCDFCTYIKTENIIEIEGLVNNIALYYYNDLYFLTLSGFDLTNEKIKHFTSSIIEFGTGVRNSNIYIKKINEYGNKIIKNKAISTCIEKFVK